MNNSYTFPSNLRTRFLLLLLFTGVLSSLLQAQGRWDPASVEGLTGRYGAGSCVIDGKIYIIGGQTLTENVGIIEIYDPKSDTWETPVVSGSPVARRLFGTAVVNNKIYTLCGDEGTSNTVSATNQVDVFDVKTSTWSAVSTTGLTTTLRIMNAFNVNDKIYCFNGIDDSGNIRALVIFDPATNSWSTPLTLGSFTPRKGAAAAMIHGKVYLFGGVIGSGPNTTHYNTVVVFDIATNTWSNVQTSGYSVPRAGQTAQIVDGKIYVMGGTDGSYSNVLEIFDPLTNTWTTPATTGNFSARNALCSAVIDGKIYVIGGAGKGDWAINEVLTPNAIDPSSLHGTWTIGSSEGFTPRMGHCAATVNGKIYVIGGVLDLSWPPTNSQPPTNIIEVYDPNTDSWSTPVTTGTFNPRTSATANAVNGKIYVIGGYDTLGIVYDVSVFDPSTNEWSTAPATADFYPRQDHTSAVIDGKIYVFGGSDDFFPLNVTDVFDPATNTWLALTTTGLFYPRYALTASVFGDKAYVFGGYNSSTRVWCNWIDIFDNITNSWTPATIMGDLTPNCFVSSQIINDKLYIIGGNTPNGMSRRVEAFDITDSKIRPVIATGPYIPVNSMATVMLNGKIYVLGGYYYEFNTHKVMNTNQIFTPTPSNSVSSIDVETSELMITPNPASKLTAITNIPAGTTSMSIVDQLGKTLLTQDVSGSSGTIDISSLPTGSYFIKLSGGFETVSGMIIKQ